jgi:coatomer protein complex subunit gamma
MLRLQKEDTPTFGSIPQLAHLGAPFQSTAAARLTEEETEYSVSLVKHLFESHLLLQFNCTNTVAEQVLEDVSVSLDLSDAVSTPLIP